MKPVVAAGSIAALALVMEAPHAAHAQALARIAVRAEGGIGLALPQYQRNTLGENVGVQGSARVAVSPVDALALEIGFSSWYFTGDGGGAQIYALVAGARFEPRVASLGRFFIDVHAGWGQTISLARATFDAAVGFEFRVHPWLALGPVVRYGALFAAGGDYPSHAQYGSIGLSVTAREPTRAQASAPPRDGDHDGVIDPEDLCPTVPAGPHPDPERRGCPFTGPSDRDGDGVLDLDDLCPTIPAGEHPDPERRGCPDGDDDGDGVPNHTDQCPHETAGISPDPTRPGCPRGDRDHDSVPDDIDACPDVPGAPSTDPARNGCPGLVLIQSAQITISTPVFFAPARAEILERSAPVLQAVADAMRASPGIRLVAVEGHTDDLGDPHFNDSLSRRRAESVVDWLRYHGIHTQRLEAHGYGQTRPLRPGRSAEARATNRRVEFHIIDPPLAGAPSPAAAAATAAGSESPAP